MYFAGVLHRDVSIGNILITPPMATDKGTEPQDCGQLIDLDHAKRAIGFSPYDKYEPTEAMLEEMHAQVNRSIDDSVIVQACVYYGPENDEDAAEYLRKLHQAVYGSRKTEILTMEELRWIALVSLT